MFTHRYILALGISIAALLISIALDRLLSPLPTVTQFILQVPLLVLIVDEGRRYLIQNAGFPADDVNGAFFFAAPLAALGATSLFLEIRQKFRI
jgi:hypothetical protein